MVPVMVVLFGMVPVIAKGTSVAVIVPTSIMGTLSNRSNANVDLKVAAVAGGSGVVSAIAGGVIADGISPGVGELDVRLPPPLRRRHSDSHIAI